MAENAAVAEEEPAEERTFDCARTVALSDGVFAIALTLLVLNISVPVLAPAHHDLGAGLLDRHSEFSSYALSFVVISFLWIRHHGFFRVLDRIDAKLTVLNCGVSEFVIVALGCAHPRRVKVGGRARAVARRTGRGCLPIAAISLVPVSPSIVWRGSLARIPGLLP